MTYENDIDSDCASQGTDRPTPLAQEPVMKTLWPADPKRDPAAPTEEVRPDRGDNVRRITNITQPSFTVHRADTQGTHPAVLVFPGGGYGILAINLEGTEVADWLNSIGITAIVVKYTVPDNRPAAFQDGQRAIRLVRHHALDWGIDPTRIGVLGFSAGGHLSARLSTDFNNGTYADLDDADKLSYRPDFCILIYPAYLADKATGDIAPELPITHNTPPTFILQTNDDSGFIDGTIAYDTALKKAGVSSTFHRFAVGGHGYGLRPSDDEVSNWPALCQEWLETNQLIP